MFKKTMSVILAVLMVVMTAGIANAETFTAGGAFTLRLSDDWEADTSYNDEYSDASDQYYFLGFLIGYDAVIEMAISYESGYAGESLSQMDDDDLEDYQDALKEWLEEDSTDKAKYVGLYEVGSKNIPFMVFKVTSKSNGDYYYAECLSGGWCISFTYYMYYEDDALTTEGLNDLLDVLSTFTPVL